MKKITFLLTFLSAVTVYGQQYESIIRDYLINIGPKYGYTPADFNELQISSTSFSTSLNANNVYVSQYHNGIEVLNSSSSIVVKNNKVLHAALSFQKNIATKINVVVPTINPSTAVQIAFNNLSLENPSIQFQETLVNGTQIWRSSLHNEPILVKRYLVPHNESLISAWQVGIYTNDQAHYYNAYVGTQSGTFLYSNDMVIACNFGESQTEHIQHTTTSYSFTAAATANKTATSMMDNASYRVFALPAESPNHANGMTTVVTNPANSIASPLGWHDTNNMVGPEYFSTRGNNVYAQEDRDGVNGTFGLSPDGGRALRFDFTYTPLGTPDENLDLVTTNLFYMNNVIHDVWYQYGFDEQSGNFQENNYGKGGLQNDYVIADAQDGSGFNNATFFPPSDGNNGRMNMFLWTGSQANAIDTFTIQNGTLAGSYAGVPASFGNELPDAATPLLGQLALMVDDNSGGTSTDVNDGCDVLLNPGSLVGKIAVVRRGTCQFGEKVLAAESAGAIAVIVVNNQATAPIAMGPGNVGDTVTIPSIMISQQLGESIISLLQAGNVIDVALNNDGVQPNDGSLDNGIVIHEYGHGISNRLTGGPTVSGCLSNSEQMGEGWSDWMGLVMTIEPGDTGADRRGIGTFVTNQSTTGRGIRNFPYSTDRTINPVTYASTNNPNFSQPHGIGSIWATMLWDLTWRFIDDYGFDPDIYNGTGGNNIVMQLVTDGLKLQPCSPGFVDGRDAILLADQIANNGVNRDRIWEVFAARGLGLSAVQGSSNDRADQSEAFDTPPPLSIETVNDATFTLFPNPAQSSVTLALQTAVMDGVITIYDLNGRVLLTQKSNNQATARIDTSNLNNGIYIVEVKTPTSQQKTKLIIAR